MNTVPLTLFTLPSCCMCGAVKSMLNDAKLPYVQVESEDACRENNIATVPTLMLSDGTKLVGPAIISYIREVVSHE